MGSAALEASGTVRTVSGSIEHAQSESVGGLRVGAIGSIEPLRLGSTGGGVQSP